jgi:trimeric autotransporter adhesin
VTIGTDNAKDRPRVRPAGRVTVLVAAATVAALVPAAAAAGQSRPAHLSPRSAAGAALAAGDISTVAGGKGPGPAPATSVAFSPCGVSFAAGSVYAAASATVRQVSQAGTLTTPAGTGSFGPLGDAGLATRASLTGACGTTVDGSGNLIIADAGSGRVRAVAAKTGTFYGQAMTAGDIYTVAGGGTGPLGDGGPATFAEIGPDGVALDAAGNLVIADRRNNRIRVVAAKTGTSYGQAMTAGDIYTVAGGGTSGLGDGGPATKAQLSAPVGVAVGTAGNLVVADEGTNRIRVVAVKTGTFYGQAMTAGDIYTVAGDGNAGFYGDGGPATKAELSAPAGVAVDTAGNLLIADLNNDRVRVAAAKTGTFYGRAMTAGDIYTIAGNGTVSYSGDGGPATGAQLNRPGWVAVDAAGNLVIADSNFRIRVVAAKTGTFYGRAMTAGDIYTVAGGNPAGFSGDGGPATSAELSDPRAVAVAVTGAGGLVFADTANNRIREVAG